MGQSEISTIYDEIVVLSGHRESEKRICSKFKRFWLELEGQSNGTFYRALGKFAICRVIEKVVENSFSNILWEYLNCQLNMMFWKRMSLVSPLWCLVFAKQKVELNFSKVFQLNLNIS